MFRHLRSNWLVSCVVASVAVCSVAHAQKEKDIDHQFEVSGDLDLVRKFAKEYEQRYKTSEIFRKLCDSPPKPKEAAEKGSLSIRCKESTSTSVIGEMAAVYADATKEQKPGSTLTMTVFSGK